MSEREIIKSIIDFSFIIKAQLYSNNTTLLRSILSIAIMEAEDILERLDHSERDDSSFLSRSADG